MKRFITALFTLLISSALYALPIGNPCDASLLCDGVFWEGDCCRDPCDPCLSLCDAWSLRIGFYGDYVYDRHMKVDTNENHSTIHRTELYTNAGYLAFNMWDRIDFFATLGASHIFILSHSDSFGTTSLNRDDIIVDTETDVSWSVGARGTIWEWGCLCLGAEAQYFYTHPDVNYLKEEADGEPPFYPDNDTVKYREWQIGLGAAYRVNIAACNATALIPYMGIKWSRSRIDMDNALFPSKPLTLFNLKSDRYFGYAVGITFVGCNKISVTLEGRFADERALHLNAQIRF